VSPTSTSGPATRRGPLDHTFRGTVVKSRDEGDRVTVHLDERL